MTVNQCQSNVVINLPLLCDENAEFFGFGGSFGVVSPGEKLGDEFELQIQKREKTERKCENCESVKQQ